MKVSVPDPQDVVPAAQATILRETDCRTQNKPHNETEQKIRHFKNNHYLISNASR